ncbi:efflux RND transporter periplasmic adaptor subunit [Zooshikella harenae]|uniref:Efflux RND transporter periplasmic adaptor subunit n=1 Tax=Zooshikella harenae TaxID=2827238 RepID=A0ABS5Z7Y1_9GAMM|nr:efflux RND transporter periplasmic adaptor subunit [Zooshikella harenae]MBU2710110.1 efflux RND transporter periplasmic adaptor subunit [Zooshikella harenae]
MSVVRNGQENVQQSKSSAQFGLASLPEHSDYSQSASHSTRRNSLWVVLIGLLILGVTAGLAAYWLVHPSRIPKRPIEARPPMVTTMKVGEPKAMPIISGFGHVEPIHQVTVNPEVTAMVKGVSAKLSPGNWVQKGDVLVQLDAREYRLALRKAEAALAIAEAEYQQARGLRDKATKEFKFLGGDLTPAQRALERYEPQLKAAEAKLEEAKTNVELAKLNVERTTLTAPFSGVISSKKVEAGQLVTTQQTLFTLVDTHAFWIKASISADVLSWLSFGAEQKSGGSKAEVALTSGATKASFSQIDIRKGVVWQRLPELSRDSRQVNVLIKVNNPLGNERLSGSISEKEPLTPLFINDFVALRIQGPALENVFTLPEGMLREGDVVWLFDEEGRLRKRPVNVVYKQDQQVLVSGNLKPTDELVSSHLSIAIDGMPLRKETEKQMTAQKNNTVATTRQQSSISEQAKALAGDKS